MYSNKLDGDIEIICQICGTAQIIHYSRKDYSLGKYPKCVYCGFEFQWFTQAPFLSIETEKVFIGESNEEKKNKKESKVRSSRRKKSSSN